MTEHATIKAAVREALETRVDTVMRQATESGSYAALRASILSFLLEAGPNRKLAIPIPGGGVAIFVKGTYVSSDGKRWITAADPERLKALPILGVEDDTIH